jgi:hypothetical protein
MKRIKFSAKLHVLREHACGFMLSCYRISMDGVRITCAVIWCGLIHIIVRITHYAKLKIPEFILAGANAWLWPILFARGSGEALERQKRCRQSSAVLWIRKFWYYGRVIIYGGLGRLEKEAVLSDFKLLPVNWRRRAEETDRAQPVCFPSGFESSTSNTESFVSPFCYRFNAGCIWNAWTHFRPELFTWKQGKKNYIFLGPEINNCLV